MVSFAWRTTKCLLAMVSCYYSSHRRARSIFTVYAVFQNLLGGAVTFFNLTVLLHHFIYITQKWLSIIRVKKVWLVFLTTLKGFHIKSDHILARFRGQIIIKGKSIFGQRQRKIWGFLAGKTLVVFEKDYGVEFLNHGGAVNFSRVVVVDRPRPPPACTPMVLASTVRSFLMPC